jgi:hypothetical protein
MPRRALLILTLALLPLVAAACGDDDSATTTAGSSTTAVGSAEYQAFRAQETACGASAPAPVTEMQFDAPAPPASPAPSG